ncbi:MAG: hemin-degrading factor [Bacteroidetes bacterium]|nr:hemin-degrading factor [Bacteroidota bacterium]
MKQTANAIPANDPQEIEKLWNEILTKNPRTRIRNVADQLQISEAQLLATKVGETVTRLEVDWKSFIKKLPLLGKVMSLTRNKGCVLEHKGIFDKVIVSPHATTVIGPIETRAFLHSWAISFAVTSQTKGKTLKSIQVFDKYGDAITKIYLQDESDVSVYDELVKDNTAQDQNKCQAVALKNNEDEYDENFNRLQLKKEWSQLKDTHDFFGLLRKHRANRLEAIKAVVPEFAHQINKSQIELVLNTASSTQLPIMIFVSNLGNIQIHQDVVKKIVVMENWLNVLDKDFNMHLNMEEVDTAWVVKKPTTEGIVTSIELFDHNKEMVVQFFGYRKPGQKELTEWKNLLEKLV